MAHPAVPTILTFTRGRLPADDDAPERWDDVYFGSVTHVPSKGDTVRLEGKLYGVTRVHFNADLDTPILYAFVHLGLSASMDDDAR